MTSAQVQQLKLSRDSNPCITFDNDKCMHDISDKLSMRFVSEVGIVQPERAYRTDFPFSKTPVSQNGHFLFDWSKANPDSVVTRIKKLRLAKKKLTNKLGKSTSRLAKRDKKIRKLLAAKATAVAERDLAEVRADNLQISNSKLEDDADKMDDDIMRFEPKFEVGTPASPIEIIEEDMDIEYGPMLLQCQQCRWSIPGDLAEAEMAKGEFDFEDCFFCESCIRHSYGDL